MFLKKGFVVYKLPATGGILTLSRLDLHVYDTVFNLFYICFQRASEIRFLRLQERLKYKLTFVKNNHDRSQTVGLGKKPTVMSTCSFRAEKKLDFLSLFSESLPALKNSWLRASILGN